MNYHWYHLNHYYHFPLEFKIIPEGFKVLPILVMMVDIYKKMIERIYTMVDIVSYWMTQCSWNMSIKRLFSILSLGEVQVKYLAENLLLIFCELQESVRKWICSWSLYWLITKQNHLFQSSAVMLGHFRWLLYHSACEVNIVFSMELVAKYCICLFSIQQCYLSCSHIAAICQHSFAQRSWVNRNEDRMMS